MKRRDAGDGDLCPLDASHGHMLTMTAIKGGLHQYCPNVSHDAETRRPFFPLFPENISETEKRALWGDR